MSTKDFLNLGKETNKGSALHALKDEGAAGSQTWALLTLTGVVVDTQAFTLGSDVYEVNVIATDNTLDTGLGGEYNNTSPGPIQVPLTSAQVAVGDVLLIGTEFLKVTAVGSSSSTVVRGYAGSTIAAHANSATILEAVQQVVAGNFAVPVSATAAATADGQIVAAVNYFAAGANEQLGGGTAKVSKSGLTVAAVQGAGTTVLFHYAADRVPVAASTETFTNGAFGGALFNAGVEPASQRYSRIPFVSSGVGTESYVAPFDVIVAAVTVFDADGSLINPATVVVTATVTSNRLVDVAGAGKVAGQIIVLEMFE